MRIKIAATDKEFSGFGGLIVASELMKSLNLEELVAGVLPGLKRFAGRSVEKFRGFILSFCAGADCLDDIERLHADGVFASLMERSFTAKRYGDFLRSFSGEHLYLLRGLLTRFAFKLRQALFAGEKDEEFILDIDTSLNRQYAKVMEGVELNYKGFTSLDTLQAYDQYGIQYWQAVREGATHTSVGCVEVVASVFQAMPETMSGAKRFVRTDSGIWSVEFSNVCHQMNADYVSALSQAIFAPHLAHRITNWQATNPQDPERLRFYDGRECEFGEMIYFPERSLIALRVVALRAPNQEGSYDHYAWVTSLGSHEWSVKDIILFYRKRGHAENYIRESKYGFDLKHYPCLKLSANKAYALMAAIAYNLMRFLSLTHNRKKPTFAKLTRFRFISLPVQIIRHGREVVFRFMRRHYEEVKRFLQKIKILEQNMLAL